jgi:hypothetical protein
MFLNIGCGSVFVSRRDWVNIDLNAQSESVSAISLDDVLRQFGPGSFQAAYCSHLIEHLPTFELQQFLKTVLALLVPGGRFRVVTPDFDSLVLSYAEAIKGFEFEKASVEKVLLLDQLVRTTSGGDYRRSLQSLIDRKGNQLREYIKVRSGEDIGITKGERQLEVKSRRLWAVFIRGKRRISKRVRKFALMSIRALMPSGLKGNILLTEPGERHMWVYSYYELSSIALEAGFSLVEQVDNRSSSSIPLEDVMVLDCGDEGGVRKGSHSIFVELVK